MIPKTIHYCWFGGNPKPKLAEKCIASWQKYCKDYEIVEWNEGNFDISKTPLYVRQAYEAKKWAFVSDYVRLKVVFDNGGIYLDTDVELIKPLDSLLKYRSFFGFEYKYVATGLGFGAEKGSELLQDIMNQYTDIPFWLSDDKYDDTGCPERNTEVFIKHGLLMNGSTQVLDGNTIVLSKEYLCPYDFLMHKLKKTKNTIAIHWYEGSWLSNEDRKKFLEYEKELKKANRKNLTYKVLHSPFSCLRKVLGNDHFDSIKEKIKR